MSIYQSLYDLINQYVFNNSIVVNSAQDLATTLLSLCGCIFLIVLPFVVVYWLIRLLMRLGG